MPRLDRDRPAAGPLVQAFVGQGFRIDGAVYDSGVKLTPRSVHEWTQPYPLNLDDLCALEPAPEFILLGTGALLRRPDPAFVETIQAKGIGLEVMDSRAAARAWGVLRGEDRWIAAALMPLNQS